MQIHTPTVVQGGGGGGAGVDGPPLETHEPWGRFVIDQSLTTTVVQIVRLSKSTLSPDEDLQQLGRIVVRWNQQSKTIELELFGEFTVPIDIVSVKSDIMWIPSLTLREYQWGSRSISLTSSQSR